MFNWFRPSSKSAPRIAPAGRSTTPPAARTMTVSEFNALIPDARQLSSHARSILIRLPAEVRPLHSASTHPWMLDRLLDKWDMPALFRAELNDLLIDTRGDRKGFDFDTLTELSALGDYYNSHVHPPSANAWTTIDTR